MPAQQIGLEYYDVRGLPVVVATVDGVPASCFQCSSGRPEPFFLLQIDAAAKRITVAQWRELIQACRLGW